MEAEKMIGLQEAVMRGTEGGPYPTGFPANSVFDM